MKRKTMITLALMVAFMATAGTGFAATETKFVTFSVTLETPCSIDTSSVTLDFGTFIIGAADQTAIDIGNLTVTCPTGTVYDWGVDGGQNVDANGNNLKASGGELITYVVTDGTSFPIGDQGLETTDSGYTPTSIDISQGGATGNGSPQSYTLKADVAINAATVAGAYTDTVNFVLAW